MTVLAHSLDGLLRIRRQSTNSAVVEIRSAWTPGTWTYCVWRSSPLDEAMKLFINQCQYHTDPSQFIEPVHQPGV